MHVETGAKQIAESRGWQIGFCFSSSDWMFYIFGDWSVVMEAMSELVASAVVDSIALYSFSINEDSFGWQPAARRGADCGSIAASDAEHCACPADVGAQGRAAARAYLTVAWILFARWRIRWLSFRSRMLVSSFPALSGVRGTADQGRDEGARQRETQPAASSEKYTSLRRIWRGSHHVGVRVPLRQCRGGQAQHRSAAASLCTPCPPSCRRLSLASFCSSSSSSCFFTLSACFW